MELTAEKLRSMMSAMEELQEQAEQTEEEACEQLAQIHRNIVQLQRLLDQACSSIATTNRYESGGSAEGAHGRDTLSRDEKQRPEEPHRSTSQPGGFSVRAPG